MTPRITENAATAATATCLLLLCGKGTLPCPQAPQTQVELVGIYLVSTPLPNLLLTTLKRCDNNQKSPPDAPPVPHFLPPLNPFLPSSYGAAP